MAGYENGDIQCWETAWRQYSAALGQPRSRLLLSELQYWIRVLRDVSVRQISFYPHCCQQVTADECVSLCLLAAHQHQDLPTARGATHWLTGLNPSPAFDLLLDASSSFASALCDADQILLPVPLHLIEHAATLEGQAQSHMSTKH
ncbi:MAG: hypothetical protein AAGI06_13370 [Pseudomonadota bacterium]